MRLDDLPVFGICGWSGSGKTTLIEQVVPHLCKKGLYVAVVKHDAHGLDLDRPREDSDRCFCAGVDVRLVGPGEELLRVCRPSGSDWPTLPSAKDSPGAEPCLSYCDFRARPLLEQAAAQGCSRPGDIAGNPKVISPVPPPSLAPVWRSASAGVGSRPSSGQRRIATVKPADPH